MKKKTNKIYNFILQWFLCFVCFLFVNKVRSGELRFIDKNFCFFPPIIYNKITENNLIMFS